MDEKVAKKFSKEYEYIVNVLQKLEKKSGKRPPPSATTQATTSMSTNTPSSTDGVDVVMADMMVEEAMDMDPDSDSDAEGDDNEDDDDIMVDNGTIRRFPLNHLP